MLTLDGFNTIKIDGNTIYRGNDFTLQREYIYAGEYESCTGKRIADLVGWRYSDTTITWDALPQAQFNAILGLSGMQASFVFSDESGTDVTENVRPQVITSQATRFTNPYDGSVVWKNIELQIRFVDTHMI